MDAEGGISQRQQQKMIDLWFKRDALIPNSCWLF
jgi:hypothetical protein